MEPAVLHDAAASVFLLGAARLEYTDLRHQGERILDISHTFTPPESRGQGCAARLCDAAFDFASENRLKVRPTCSYVAQTYLARFPSRQSQVVLERSTSLDSGTFDGGDDADAYGEGYDAASAPRRTSGGGGSGGGKAGIYSQKHVRAKEARGSR